MNDTTTAIFRALARAARPLQLLIGAGLYALGGGITIFLGFDLNWSVFLIGLLVVVLIQLSSFYLREYFDLGGRPFEPIRPAIQRKAPPEGMRANDQPAEVPGADGAAVAPVTEIIIPRAIFFYVAAGTLTTAAVLTILLYAQQRLIPAAFVLLGVAFLMAMAISVPPLRLAYSGYGELVTAILEANVFPALALLLQTGMLDRLAAQLTFPLTFLYVAFFLARSLQRYMEDIRLGRQTMMVRLGWQRGMSVHNALIAGAYILLAVSVIFGMPFRLGWPTFLSLPVGVYQIWQINAIAAGGKPHWRILAATALATLALTIYFMNFTLWRG